MSSGFRSAAMLREYFGEILFHRPERSGLPSGVRGAGAVRFGLPSGVRGIPAVGWVSHCAASGALKATVTTAIRAAFMVANLLAIRGLRSRGDARRNYVTNQRFRVRFRRRG